MANEVTKVELYGSNNDGDLRRYTCADGTAISKGTLLTLSDPRTVAANGATAGTIFGGIASMDKEAGDGSTSISAWTNGIFDMTASGAITVGQKVIMSNNNYVQKPTQPQAESSFALIVGTALETASDNEVINVRVLI